MFRESGKHDGEKAHRQMTQIKTPRETEHAARFKSELQGLIGARFQTAAQPLGDASSTQD